MKSAIKILIIIVLAGWPLKSEGQKFTLSKAGTAISIKGTSSLHDWVMNLEAYNSAFQLDRDGSSIKEFDNVTFSCKATDIKSEYSLMDKKAYNALKTDMYPEIRFEGMSGTGMNLDGKEFSGNLKGKLNLAGETRDVTIPFKGTFTDNNTINITAATDLTMSSFNITPPTAMMGALKTGDQISVSLSLHFVRTEKQNDQPVGD
jgi:hypothetical protein